MRFKATKKEKNSPDFAVASLHLFRHQQEDG